ncbi:MAG: metallophosphoesterase, partial [Gemmatimonadales bacterium]
FLVGDAGEPAAPPAREPVLAALEAAAVAAPNPIVVFLGDNIYPRGMPDTAAPERAEAERRLGEQLRVTRASGARGIFVPGNHDWDKHGRDGWAAIRRAEAFIAAAGAGAVLLPGEGCPGPAVVDLGATVRLVALDTQWWLHDGPKPQHPASSCPADAPDEVVAALASALRDSAGRLVVVVGHHPLRTGGPHGGYFSWDAHIFPLRAVKPWLWIPLPLIGSIYPIARANGISSQDASSAAYGRMRAALGRGFAAAPPLVYAAGHEHALQVIGGSAARYLLVSGGGTFGHTSAITALDSTRFARRASGFMRIDVLRDRRARLAVTVVDAAGNRTEAFSLWLR